MNHHDLATIRAEQVARCLEQAKLGHNDASLRLMGFADGAIIEARRFIDSDKGPYGEQNHPMTLPGGVEYDT